MLAGMNLTRFLFVSTLLGVLTACQAFQPKPSTTATPVSSASATDWLVGEFDNHAQVAKSGAAHWRYIVSATGKSGWLAWMVELDLETALAVAAGHAPRAGSRWLADTDPLPQR